MYGGVRDEGSMSDIDDCWRGVGVRYEGSSLILTNSGEMFSCAGKCVISISLSRLKLKKSYGGEVKLRRRV